MAQRTIFDRMNISEKSYYLARKKLQEMGWIQYIEAENAIYVNYDKIYADYRKYQKENKAGGYNDSSNASSIQDSPSVKELSEQSSEMQEDCCDDNQQDCHQDRYNNINNNTKNTIKNKKSSGDADAAFAASPQEELIKQMKEDDRKVYEWAQTKLKPIYAMYEQPMSSEDIDKMHESDEWKQYLKELDEKRRPLRRKYGKLYKW